MLTILLNALLVFSVQAANPSLKVGKTLKIKKDVKFTVIRSGVLSEEAFGDMEKNSPYCAIENLKLKPLIFSKGESIQLSLKKLDFPNKNIQRFALVDSRDYSFYCDFTGKMNFDKAFVISEINSQLNPVMRIVE